MNMKGSQEVSRQEFLKSISQYIVQNVRSLSNTAHGARIDIDRCLAWDGGNCQFCYLACPLRDKAITLDDQKPIVNILFCDGCAKCVTACRTVNDRPTIKMVAVEV